MLDLSKFKKVAKNKTHTIFQSPEGHIIHLAHDAMKPEHMKEAKKLPTQKMAKGGMIQAYADGGNVADESPVEQGINFLGELSGGPVTTDYQPDQSMPSNQTPVQTEQPSPTPENFPIQPQQPSTAGVPVGGLKEQVGALQEQRSGVMKEAKAEGQLGERQSQALSTAGGPIDMIQQADQQYQANRQELDQHQQNLVDAIQQQHIDPNRAFKQQSTLGRIGNVVGLMLGGLGGQRGVQMVQDNINRMVDNDINAQKIELGKNENLLSANMRQYGNLTDAVNATKANQLTIAQLQLQQLAAQSQDPIAKAKAMQLAGQYDMQIGQLHNEIAIRQALTSSTQGVDPAVAARFLVDPKELPQANKELAQVQEANQLRNDAMSSFNDIHSKVLNGTFSPNDTRSAKQAFIGKIIKLSEGRYNFEAAQNLADAVFPGKTDTDSTVANKRQRLNELMDSMIQTPVLNSYRIKVPKATRITPRPTIK